MFKINFSLNSQNANFIYHFYYQKYCNISDNNFFLINGKSTQNMKGPQQDLNQLSFRS